MGSDLEGDNIYDKWAPVVKEALSCLNLKTVTWQHLPGIGGYYDQDEYIMMIWEYIKHCYISLNNNKNDRADIDKARERL